MKSVVLSIKHVREQRGSRNMVEDVIIQYSEPHFGSFGIKDLREYKSN